MKIVDQKMSPYEIHCDSNNYEVVEPTSRTDKDGNPVYKGHGYFTSVEKALVKITKLIVEVDKTYTISEYIKQINNVKSNFIKIGYESKS